MGRIADEKLEGTQRRGKRGCNGMERGEFDVRLPHGPPESGLRFLVM